MLNIPQTIKDLFKTDGVLKNIRISFPNGERADICNDQIIKESLKFDESISSREEIKWGLCEASQLSFECVDVGNIKGMEIDAAIEIDVTGHERTEYPVDTECPVFLKIEIDGNTYYVIVSDFPELEAGQTYTTDDGTGIYYDTYTEGDYVRMKMHSLSFPYYVSVTGRYSTAGNRDMYFYSTKEQKFYGDCLFGAVSSERLEIILKTETAFTNDEWLSAIHNIRYDSTSKIYWGSDFEPTVLPDVPFPFYRIPLGRFIVDEAKRDAGMTRRKVVAYSVSTSFSIPKYVNEITSTGSLNLHVINFLQVAKKGRFLDENFLRYTDLPLATTDLHRPFQWQRTPIWQYQDDVLYDIVLSTIVTYGYVNIDADDFPSMRVLLKCNDTGIWDADRDTIEYQLGLYLAAAMEYTGDNAINYSESYITEARNLIKNVIRPLPYINSMPKEYLIGVEVGDIYPASSKIYFIENIEMTLKMKLHDSAEVGVTVFQYIFDNHRTVEYADYQIVDTSYFPQNTVLMKGYPTDDTNTFFQYLLSFLNLNFRTLLESCVEINGYFGRMGRDGYFQLLSLTEMKFDGLFPDHDILPNMYLYPVAFTPVHSDTSALAIIEDDCMISLWYEEYFVAFGRIVCEYTSSEILDENNNPVQTTYTEEWNDSDEYLTYDISNNEIIKNNTYTAAEIEALLAPLVQALKRVKFYPSDLSCVGLPYIEAGDWVLASYHGNKVLGLVLSRTLSGIQALRDKMKSD